ncbi:DNA-dependent RNA polymerase II, partial [Marasmius sp. AFHP31]
PLFIVENQLLLLQKKHVRWIANGQNDEGAEYKWEQLVKGGIVELLDAEEEETFMISMTPEDLENSRLQSQGIDPHANDGEFDPAASLKAGINTHTWTHCEIHPSMTLRICASIIPFPDHKQSPRNTYQSTAGKQAMGIFLTNFLIWIDTMANILYYPQKPLATTLWSTSSSESHLPWLQLGRLRHHEPELYRPRPIPKYLLPKLYGLEKKNGVQQLEEFEKPLRENTLRMKHGTYDKLEDDGLIAPGTGIRGEDIIIIGKTAPIRPDSEELGQRTRTHSRRDVSTPLKILITTNSEGQKFVKVRVRSTRIPQVGDKFASRHGQKGIIGITYRQEDMPFTAEGITPSYHQPSRYSFSYDDRTLGRVFVVKDGDFDRIYVLRVLALAWPFDGELDIYEGVHNYSANQATLHTDAGCTLSSSSSTTTTTLGISGTVITKLTCAIGGGAGNEGCGVRATTDNSLQSE